MKTHPLSDRRGMALVVVLVFLVLLSVFVVGFFSNSQDELTAAQSFTGEVSASHLSESAVSVVMGQIREATSRYNGAWGSQPGMIRVYREGKGNNATASAKADAFFKLYSSDDMIVSGAEIEKFDPINEVAEGAGTGWEHVPALWTNLNEPVTVEIPNVSGTSVKVNRYPILDPGLDRQVEGLEFPRGNYPKAQASSIQQIARMPVKWLYVLRDGTLTAPSGSDGDGTQATWKKGERAPTPANPIVGRVAFWTDDESCKVNINTAGGYTLKPEDTSGDGGKPHRDVRNLPFSEDDYAGSFWDTPRAFTVFDRGLVDKDGKGAPVPLGSTGELDRGGLALSQPVRGEFQRYPGHPSTTSLGIVFRGRPANPAITMQDAPYLLKSGQLALLSPRLMFGTLKSQKATNYGTTRFLANDRRNVDLNEDGVSVEDLPVGARVKRLYASVDELFYAQPDTTPAQRKQNDWELEVTDNTGGKVAANDETKVLKPDYLEKMRFFLTAHSRSPEVNLFGQPRVTIWPVHEVKTVKDESDWWNASDRLIAFCSAIGPDATKAGVQEQDVLRYLFQRVDPYSPVTDIKLNRNQAILRYLRDITSKPFPGFGGPSFEAKYRDSAFGGDSFGREQILVEIFDYIRTVNLRDSTRDKDFNKTMPMTGNPPSWPKANIVAKEKYKYAPRGIVVPAVSPVADRHGFGRFPTISEGSIVLYCSGYVGTNNTRYRNSRQATADPYGPRYVLDRDNKFVLIDPKGKDTPANRVKVKDSLVRAFFITETFNPMQGYAPTTTPHGHSNEKRGIVMQIENLHEFKLDGKPLAMPQIAENPIAYSSGSFWGGRNSGGSEGFMHTMWAWPAGRPKAGVAPSKAGLGNAPWYPFQTDPSLDATVTDTTTQVHGVPFPYETGPGVPKTTAQLEGPAELKVRMYYATSNVKPPVRDITLDFGGSVVVPMPTDVVWSVPYTGGDPNLIGTYLARSTASTYYPVKMNHPASFIEDPSQPALWACNMGFKFYSIPSGTNLFEPKDRSAKSLGDWEDPDETVTDKRIKPGRLTWIQNDSNNHMNDKASDGTPKPGPNYERRWQQILQPGDVVRSVLYGDAKTNLGDLRKSCLAVDSANASSVFSKHPEYGHLPPSSETPVPVVRPSVQRHAQTLRMADSQLYYPDTDPAYPTVGETRFGQIAKVPSSVVYPAAQSADLPFGMKGVIRSSDSKAGDFDTGIGNLADGPFCNKADEGNLAFQHANYSSGGDFLYWDYPIPYFTWVYEEAFETFFSPNRQSPSPVIFGSLLSGKGVDWQTLCFSPNPAGLDHPGSKIEPKDYLWLDLFTMPVVEPYAISEPFSTAGKINLNYQIIPFANIKRSTGLRAALQPVRVTAFRVTDTVDGTNPPQLSYKTGNPAGTPLGTPGKVRNEGINYRYLVDRDQTIQGFEEFFDEYKTDHNKGFLKAAAQICDFYLYPRRDGKPVVAKSTMVGPDGKPLEKGTTKIRAWWNQQGLTGDNLREKPYADLYPRITTKSNTFCVHVRAQALRQSAAPDASKAEEHYRIWNEKRDRVIGEYRGASIIERYVDPQDERFDLTINRPGLVKIRPDRESIDPAYRFRVLNTKRFDP